MLRRATPLLAATALLLSALLLTSLLPTVLLPASAIAAGPTTGPAAPGDPAGPGAPGSPAERRSATGRFLWANAWAAHHTAERGPSSGPQRMRRLVRLVKRHDVTLGALAELERPQIAAFRRTTSAYRLVVGGRGMTDGVFFDTRRYDVVDSYRFRGFYSHGRRVPVPVVVLEDGASGRRLALMAVHNPTDARWRDRALGRELREVERLRRTHPGATVLIAGDFNARSAVGDRAARAGLVSAVERVGGGPTPIDQLLLDEDVDLQGYRAIRPVSRITDHRAVYTTAFTVPGS